LQANLKTVLPGTKGFKPGVFFFFMHTPALMSHKSAENKGKNDSGIVDI
jgi:hypothetical protein